MVSNEVAYFATILSTFTNTCSFWSRYLVTLLLPKIAFFTWLRIVKHTVTLYNVYNVLWDAGAVSDS